MSIEDESGPYRQQEEPEEMEEPSEHVAPPQQQQHKKLTQHNQGNRVAHILSHNLIDPVEQTLSGVTGKKHGGDSNEASAPGSHLAAKLPSLVADKISKTTQADAVGSVTDKLKSVTGDIATKVGAEGVFQPLMPAIKPNDSLKALKAADKIAIAQEKAWIAKQKGGASRTGGNSASKKVAHGKDDAPSSSPKPTKLMVHQQDADDDREKAKDEAEKKQDEQEKKSKEDREKAEDKRKENFEKFEVERQKLSLEQQEKLEEQLERAHEMQQSPKKAVQASTEQPKPTSHQQGHLVDPKVTSATLHKAKQIQAAAASNKANETKAQKKEKRDAYRHVLRNRARFAKRILQ
ncbi:hypothetical protein BC940DRAFT_288702 [Gongronella butleri]|nr:hypothetical protein BC940DRAFT_288702 [Gongronella butleri]